MFFFAGTSQIQRHLTSFKMVIFALTQQKLSHQRRRRGYYLEPARPQLMRRIMSGSQRNETPRHQKPDGHQQKQVIEVGVPPPKNTKQVSSTIQSIYLFFSFYLRLACLRHTHISIQREVSK